MYEKNFTYTIGVYFLTIHTESVYFEGSEKVACRLLYSIFKFWNFRN